MTLVFAVLVLQHGRPPAPAGTVADFLPGKRSETGMTIRIEGDGVSSGVYHFDHSVDMGTVINMTVPFFCIDGWTISSQSPELYTGSSVRLSRKTGKSCEISIGNIPVAEKMLLGVPLDPNELSVGQWEKLPGIGPALAKRIVLDRQINGDYSTIEDLERVSGIGKVKVGHLECYFK